MEDNDIKRKVKSGELTVTGRIKVDKELPFHFPKANSSEIQFLIKKLKEAWGL